MSEASSNLIRLSERSPDATHYEPEDALKDAYSCLQDWELPACALVLIADRGAQGVFEYYMSGMDRAECVFLLERMKQQMLSGV